MIVQNTILSLVKAQFFWLKTPQKQFVREINKVVNKYSRNFELDWHQGVVIGIIPRNLQAATEELEKLANKYARDVSKIMSLATRPNKGYRYLVIFLDTPHVHLYYEDQFGEVIEFVK